MSKENPRIAVLGFAIECNRFSPVTTAVDFEQDVDIRGNRIVSEARSGASITLPDLPGFFAEMDRTGPWTPVPLRVCVAPPGAGRSGRLLQRLTTREIEAGLKASLPLDAVFISGHGAALAEGTDDPDGDLFEVVRRAVGPDIPVVAVFDLHANVSRKMIDNLSVFVGYLENPHTDIRERGIEAAQHMRECLAGARTAITMVKVPLVPPQISLLTAKGPYADLIKYGQTKVGGDIMNVSVMAGFAYSDSPKNGLTAVVTARNANRKAAAALSLDIAKRAWGMKERFKRAMMSLGDAVQLAASVGRDRRRKPIILADVADNPGGGGRGNTTYLLRALKGARAQGVIFGVFNDAALAAQAHKLGEGAIFTASFNSAESQRILPALRLRGQGDQALERRGRGPARRAQGHHGQHGPVGPARPRRHPARGDQPPLPVHGPAAVRDVRPRHRPGAGRRGQEPRPISQSIGKNNGAPDHLVGMRRIHPKPDGGIDGLIKLRPGRTDHQRNSLLDGIALCHLDIFLRLVVLLASLGHD